MMNEHVDISNKTNYTDTQLEQVIQTAIERAFQQLLPVLTNLDNGIREHSLSSCSKATVTISEAAKIMGISAPKMYELEKREDFPSIHLGRKIVIDRTALQEWMRRGDIKQ